jgi:XTP/dITP diphosphohydrolase
MRSRDAHFACALALAWPNDGMVESFEGRVDGTLVWPPRGDKGFGYDPMFVPRGPRPDLRRDGPGRKAQDQPPRRRVRASWWLVALNDLR